MTRVEELEGAVTSGQYRLLAMRFAQLLDQAERGETIWDRDVRAFVAAALVNPGDSLDAMVSVAKHAAHLVARARTEPREEPRQP